MYKAEPNKLVGFCVLRCSGNILLVNYLQERDISEKKMHDASKGRQSTEAGQ